MTRYKQTEREKAMKYTVQIERSALATIVVEADNPDQAESKAFAQVREEDFGYGNLYLVDMVPTEE
jgi:hypothetical protein